MPTQRPRRVLGIVVCCFCLVLGLAATVSAVKTKIVFAESTTWPEWEEAIKAFEVEHSDIEVEWIRLQHATLAESLIRFAAAGQMPDVFTILHDILPGLLANNLVRPLEPLFVRDGSVTPREYVGLDMGPKGIWALPLTVNVWFIIVNHSMFAEAGMEPPQGGWTPADMARLATRLKADIDGDGVFDRFGLIGIPITSANEIDVTLFPFNASLFDSMGRPALNTSEARQAFNFLESMIADGSAVPGGALTPAWLNGQAAMLTGDRVYLFHFAQNVKFDWGLAHLPMNPGGTPRTVGTGHYFGIANSSPNVEAAWTFLKWVTGPKGHNMVKSKAPLPGNLKAFPIYQSYWEMMRHEWNVPKNIELVTQITTYAVAPTVTRTALSQQQVNTLLRDAANGILQRQLAAETALRELQRQLEALQNQ